MDFVARIRLGVHSKLLIVFLGGAFLLWIMGFIFLLILKQIDGGVEELGFLREKMDRARQMQSSLNSQMHFRAMVLLSGDDENKDRLADAKLSFSENFDRLRSMEPGSQPVSIDSLIDSNVRFAEAGRKTMELYESGELQQALELHLSEEHPIADELEANTGLIIERASLEWDEANARLDSKRDLLTSLVWSFSGLSVALALFLSLVISWSFVRPIRQIGFVLARVAAGDFAQRVETPNRDEFGSLSANVNSMSQGLAAIYSYLEETNRSLEDRVRQRTSELEDAIDELVKAQEQVTTSEKLAAIGQMSAGVAHDLRNPLGAIRNAAYIIGQAIEGETGARDPRLRTYLDLILDEVARSDRVIVDLLSFTRVGTTVLAPARINDIIDEALRTFVVRDNVTLLNDVDPDLGTVMADVDQLQRVFLNLANNAQEAMLDGGELTVSGTRREGNLEISFADTGGGIPAENMDKIFDPLFTTKPEGIGLGLAVCQEIVNNHGGFIVGTNNAGPEGGATFVVTLPSLPS